MQIRLSNIVFFSTLLLGGSSFCAAIEVKYGKATKEGKTVALDTKFQKNDVPNFQKKGDREQAENEFGTNIKLSTRRERSNVVKAVALGTKFQKNDVPKFQKTRRKHGNVVIARQKRLKVEDIMEQEVGFLTDKVAFNQEYMSMFPGMTMSMSMPPKKSGPPTIRRPTTPRPTPPPGRREAAPTPPPAPSPTPPPSPSPTQTPTPLPTPSPTPPPTPSPTQPPTPPPTPSPTSSPTPLPRLPTLPTLPPTPPPTPSPTPTPPPTPSPSSSSSSTSSSTGSSTSSFFGSSTANSAKTI